METRLKELRTENKFKQNYVAKYLFITQTTYSNYESGERDIPLSILVKLSELYETSVDFILGLTDYDFPYPRKK